MHFFCVLRLNFNRGEFKPAWLRVAASPFSLGVNRSMQEIKKRGGGGGVCFYQAWTSKWAFFPWPAGGVLRFVHKSPPTNYRQKLEVNYRTIRSGVTVSAQKRNRFSAKWGFCVTVSARITFQNNSLVHRKTYFNAWFIATVSVRFTPALEAWKRAVAKGRALSLGPLLRL